MVSYRWFLGMIVVPTAARLVLELPASRAPYPRLRCAIPGWFNSPLPGWRRSIG